MYGLFKNCYVYYRNEGNNIGLENNYMWIEFSSFVAQKAFTISTSSAVTLFLVDIIRFFQ